MLLKNTMEDKQLNYNQPFLSVRRFTSTVSSEKNEKTKTNNKIPSISSFPYYKSELKSGPVSNPGSVPFMWEKSPGRPKYENERPAHSLEQPPIAPRLPPGRLVKVKEENLDKVSESSTPTSCEGRRVASGSLSYSSVDETTAKIEATKDEIKEDEGSDSGDNDEAYQDALDTLSRTESVFLNCSFSGLCGLDDPEVKPSGTFLTDPQTREFMMGRFLPAAKALACDSSQSAYKKKPAVVAKERPQQLKDEMGGDKRPPLYRSRPNIVPKYAEVCIEEESEDEDDDYDGPGNLSTRVCGLLPRFCLLSPVPGVSVRTRAPMPPVSRRQVRTSSPTSHQETKEEGTGSARQQQGSMEQNQRPELLEHNLFPENNNQNLDGSSLYRRLHGSGISTHESKLPQSRFHKEAEVVAKNSFNSEKRCADNFKELSGHQGIERDIGSATPVVEKTVYVDSVHKVTSPQKKSVPFDLKELEECKKHDAEISKVKGFDATPLVVGSVYKDIEDPKIMEENGVFKEENMKALGLLSANLKVHNYYYQDTGNQQKVMKVETTENSSDMDFQFLIPPPLPKSPSESWLCRTLPSMSSKNSNSRSFLGNNTKFQNQVSKVSSGDLKWENNC